MRLKMQMDLQIELHAERELELSNFAGSNAGAAHELRQQNEERWSELQVNGSSDARLLCLDPL